MMNSMCFRFETEKKKNNQILESFYYIKIYKSK